MNKRKEPWLKMLVRLVEPVLQRGHRNSQTFFVLTAIESSARRLPIDILLTAKKRPSCGWSKISEALRQIMNHMCLPKSQLETTQVRPSSLPAHFLQGRISINRVPNWTRKVMPQIQIQRNSKESVQRRGACEPTPLANWVALKDSKRWSKNNWMLHKKLEDQICYLKLIQTMELVFKVTRHSSTRPEM